MNWEISWPLASVSSQGPDAPAHPRPGYPLLGQRPRRQWTATILMTLIHFNKLNLTVAFSSIGTEKLEKGKKIAGRKISEIKHLRFSYL